ncbi:MAG: response regulator [Reichenbachiella sp.]
MRKITLLILLLLIFVSAKSQNQSIRFNHVTTKNGLSINRITAIHKDKAGYMWFGTYWGLNRYDGKEVKNYFHSEDVNEISLTHNSIRWIEDGPNDIMLIQTGAEISGYDVYKEQFVDISELLGSIPVQSGQVAKVVKDNEGNVWMIGITFGLFKITPEGEVIFLNSNERGVFQNTPEMHDILLDENGNLVVAQQDGKFFIIDVKTHAILDSWYLNGVEQGDYLLDIFIDSKKGIWTYARYESEGILYFKDRDSSPILISEKQIGSNLVSSVLEDDLGRIVISTDHGGVTIINTPSMEMSRHEYNPSDPTSLNHYGAVSAYKDDEGTMWIGTNKGGVSYFNPSANAFNYYKYKSETDEVFNDINATIAVSEKEIWIGSDAGGLMLLNTVTNEYEVICKETGTSSNNLISTTVVSLAKGKNGIWIGTYHGGLNFYDGNKYISYIDKPGLFEINDNSVWALLVDSKDNLWTGTLRGGVSVFNANHKKIDEISIANGKLDSNYITDMDEDENGNIWIGTGFGFHKYNLSTKKIDQWLKDTQDVNSLINNSIEKIHCDQKGNVWIGTQNGLSKYSIENNSFKNYTEKQGLSSSYIVSIEEDENGGIWVGTNKGISHIESVENETFIRNYNESDGLQGELFNQNSSSISEDGLMVFAGANGLNIFRSENINYKSSVSKNIFNEFKIDNQEVVFGKDFNGRVVLDNGLNQIERIDLKHFENSLSIGFAALNFQRPEKVVYRYMLEGFDKHWLRASPNQRSANYTNLDPGNYVFRVQSTSDVSFTDDNTIELRIMIATPFWKTPLAYFGYLTIGLFILYFLLRIRIDRERLKAEIENEKVQAKRLHELDLMKIRFFTNIGHEFRTPLTLILTPVERILNSVHDSQFSKEYMVIQKNAKRLLTLVNQLLDFRKMEAGQHQLSLSGGDLVGFVKDIIESFSDLSNENSIKIHFHTEYHEFLTQFDRDKMEKVFFNLLSNAFKFTEPNGEISIRIKTLESNNEEHKVRISVSDTGIGIPAENLSHVFARFYQSDVPSNMINHGSGIGLSITKEFVELHGGEIRVESVENQGTTFTLDLPLTKKSIIEETEPVENSIEEGIVQDQMNTLNNKKYTVILVEDNADFRYYLKDNLGQYFNMLEAENGEIGYNKTLQYQPDLIVSDVMMPVMNGIEMTERIKKERKTKHIPIILLSSHQSDTHKIEGLKAGAMDFISKPFNFEILENRIKSALRLKENITDSQKKIEVSPSEIAVTSLDEKLIQKALAIVEENMSNADFSVQELSRELGVSRAQLYKKVVSITGQSPIEFIRDIRLKRAALLLEKSQLSVSEIAYKVGFNNPRYFSNYFKAAYKTLPSKYLDKKREEAEVVS